MLASWEMKQERQAPRYPKISKMEVIWGLPDIHKVLSSDDPLQANIDSDDIEQVVEDTSLLIEHHWNTVNNSNGGICISQPQEKIKEIDVGLLMAIRESINGEKSSKWTLGIICWIIGNKRNGTQIGIKYIKGDIQTVRLQARKGNKIDTRFQRALLVSGQKVEGLSTPTLLTSIGLYIDSRPMLLKIGEEEQFIHARMRVSSTGSVDRFFYQLDTQHLNNVKDNKDSNANEDEDGEDGEVINLRAVPLSRSPDFDAAKKAQNNKIVTLDDITVSKNK